MTFLGGEPKAKVTSAPRKWRRWTEAEDLAIERDWTITRLGTMASQLGRTPAAVRSRAAKLRLGGMMRGSKSLRRVATETGYGVNTLKLAAERAGVRLARAPSTLAAFQRLRHRVYRVTPEDEGAILDFLKRHPDGVPLRSVAPTDALWARRGQSGCRTCGRADRRHYAKGQCQICYNADHAGDRTLCRRGLRPSDPARVEAARARWDAKGLPGCQDCGGRDRAPWIGAVCQACYSRAVRRRGASRSGSVVAASPLPAGGATLIERKAS